MALSHSASAPGLGSSGILKTAGGLASNGSMPKFGDTTNLYDQMKAQGKFNEAHQHIRPAGRSITVPLADSSERDIQPEIYFPAPSTPAKERRYRQLSYGPGEIHVHHGLKDQKLPHEEFRYGIRSESGVSAEKTMKAGQVTGVAEYKQSVAERVYESTKMEPLGKPHIRGHTIKMLPEGFGNHSGIPVNGKDILYPVDVKDDSEEMKAMYRFTHGSFAPGEQANRKYTLPDVAKHQHFRYGVPNNAPPQGRGARLALNMDCDDHAEYPKTRMVQRTSEDYKHVNNATMFKTAHAKQGAGGPPVPPGTRFGIKSTSSDITAKSCIQGFYSLQDQLPDQDLGCCTKPGRRNVTVETRAFGIPCVRTDIPAPHPSKRSCADMTAYGDQYGIASLVNPQRFDNRGVSDAEFLVRRSKEALEPLLENLDLPNLDFESLWQEALSLFDDDVPLVSIDALLYVHSKKVDMQVSQSLSKSQSMPSLVRT